MTDRAKLFKTGGIEAVGGRRARPSGQLFEQVFEAVASDSLHSVSLGPFRLPRPFFRRLEKMYGVERLLAGPFEDYGGMVSYGRELEEEMVGFCTSELLERVPEEIFFPCEVPADRPS